MAIAGLILFFERFLYLHRGHINKNKFLAGVKALVGKGRLVEALTLCEESPGPVTSIVRAALLHFEEGRDAIRHGIQAAALNEVPLLERRLGGDSTCCEFIAFSWVDWYWRICAERISAAEQKWAIC